jgi:c(7)-type cytochrome triheme protein
MIRAIINNRQVFAFVVVQPLCMEVPMRMVIAAVIVLLFGNVAFAVVGGGEITIKNDEGNTVFSHELHVKSADLQCQDCHAKIYLNKKKHTSVTMQEMEKGKSCGSCHDGKAAFNVQDNCKKCHSQDQSKQGGNQ